MSERVEHMFEAAAQSGHGSIWTILLIGFCFGAVILYTRLDKFEKMAGFLLFEDTMAIRMAMLTVGLGSIGFYLLVRSGHGAFDAKPLLLGGIAVGAVLFGIGLVIFGKCPSAFFVSVAEGRIDALVGVAGGMAGGAVFTVFYPWIERWTGPDFGPVRLNGLVPEYAGAVTVVFGLALIAGAWLLPTRHCADPAEPENGEKEMEK